MDAVRDRPLQILETMQGFPDENIKEKELTVQFENSEEQVNDISGNQFNDKYEKKEGPSLLEVIRRKDEDQKPLKNPGRFL